MKKTILVLIAVLLLVAMTGCIPKTDIPDLRGQTEYLGLPLYQYDGQGNLIVDGTSYTSPEPLYVKYRKWGPREPEELIGYIHYHKGEEYNYVTGVYTIAGDPDRDYLWVEGEVGHHNIADLLCRPEIELPFPDASNIQRIDYHMEKEKLKDWDSRWIYLEQQPAHTTTDTEVIAEFFAYLEKTKKYMPPNYDAEKDDVQIGGFAWYSEQYPMLMVLDNDLYKTGEEDPYFFVQCRVDERSEGKSTSILSGAFMPNELIYQLTGLT